MLKRLGRSSAVQSLAGGTIAGWTRLIGRTTKSLVEPADFDRFLEAESPVIFTFWHGEHFLLPLIVRPGMKVAALISHHRDGEINARAVRPFGVELVRGSGAPDRRYDRKGGVRAFSGLMRMLRSGRSVGLTADVPKISRVAGAGVIQLARHSGRPIVPLALATSNFRRLDSWDRSVINLPFGRFAQVFGEPLRVPREADAAAIEQARTTLEARLNATTKRAYALVRREEGY